MSKHANKATLSVAEKNQKQKPNTEHKVLIALIVLLVLSAGMRIAQTHVPLGWSPVKAQVTKVETVNYIDKKVSVEVAGNTFVLQDTDPGWKTPEGKSTLVYAMDGKLYAKQANVLDASPLTLVWNVLLGLDVACGLTVIVMYVLRTRKSKRSQ